MNRKTLSVILGGALVGAVVVGVGISHAATPVTTKTTPKPAVVTQTAVSKVKISQDEAAKIALKAHKDGKITNIQRVKLMYTVHLQTPQGNVTMKIGANTGRILGDVLEKAPVAPKAPVVDTKNEKAKTDDVKTGDIKTNDTKTTDTKTTEIKPNDTKTDTKTDAKANDTKTSDTKAPATKTTDTTNTTTGSASTDKK